MHAQTPARRARLALVGGLTALVLGASGCAPDRVDSPATEPTAGPDPDEVGTPVLQIRTGGGLAGPCCPPWVVPQLTAYEDGRVVWTEGTVGQVPGMRQSAISASDLADLLDRAQANGLLAPGLDAGTLCCDLPETQIMLRAGTTTNELSITGLGHERDADGDHLTKSQRQLRRAIEDLVLLLMDRAEDSDAYGGYAPDEVALYVFPVSGDAHPQAPAWPLPYPLADGGTPVRVDGRCLRVTGSDDELSARRVIATARDADTATWSSGDRDWFVHFRPMLPHEDACAP